MAGGNKQGSYNAQNLGVIRHNFTLFEDWIGKVLKYKDLSWEKIAD